MNISALTDIGKVRKNNEDSYETGIFEGTDTVWAIVCDGMGGALGGKVASSMCVESVKSFLQRSFREDISLNSLESVLKNALVSANIEVYDKSICESSLFGMGTTAVVAVITGEHAVIAHVGDSRAYLLRGGSIKQITKDHSVVQHYIDIGRISPEQARSHPERNVITRAIGVEKDVSVDIDIESLEPEDVILICTDGLSGCIEDCDILKICSESVDGGVPELVQAALDAGGIDNVTVVAVRV